jgi:hypothetical protein
MRNGTTTPVKVLGFDNWTRGSHHYVRLLAAFAARNMTLQLVHIGSWGNDVGRSKSELIDALPVRDITSYRDGSLEEVLDSEKPDVVVFLSTTTFAHRAFIRYCRVRGIPTLNLYHGMSTTWFDPVEKAGFRASPLGHARFVLGRLGKTIRDTLPCYGRALACTGASAADWGRFLKDIAMMLVGKHILVASDDARTDLYAVYTDSEVAHALYTYGGPKEAIHVVGNPDLVRFGVLREHLGSGVGRDVAPPGDVMYIDTALQANAMMFASVSAFANHLRDVADAVSRSGFRLLLKLHPANDIAGIKQRLQGANVEFVDMGDFIGKLSVCKAAIVETTTLAIMPALLGLPVLFANFGALGALKFGSALTSYPRGRFLRVLGDFDALLHEIDGATDANTTLRWIERSSGPLPAEDMPARVAELVQRLVRRANGSASVATSPAREPRVT